MSKRDDRETARLTDRAVRGGWPVPFRAKRKAARTMERLLRATDDNTKIRAGNALVGMDALNLKRESWEWEKDIVEGRLTALEQQAQGQLPQGEAAAPEPEKPAE